jgi:hypothetical protein
LIPVLFAVLAGAFTAAPPGSAVATHEGYARFYTRQAQLAARYKLPWEAYRLEHRAYIQLREANAVLKRQPGGARSTSKSGFDAAGSYGWGRI